MDHVGINITFPDIASTLFGDEVFHTKMLLKAPISRFLRSICASVWNRMRTKLNRDRNKIESTRKTMEEDREGKY